MIIYSIKKLLIITKKKKREILNIIYIPGVPAGLRFLLLLVPLFSKQLDKGSKQGREGEERSASMGNKT